MKQTAVDWLEYNLYKAKIPAIVLVDILELIQQAKEIEKEQIENAYIEGIEQPYIENIDDRILFIKPLDLNKSAENYYNKSYEK